jgi:serine/threonine-protein kinase
VLPLHAPTVPESVRFLAVGIPDAIITRLASVPQVLPRPTTAILRFENQPLDAKAIGRELSSEYVLTGILQQVGDKLRVSVQLVRTADASPVWGHAYDVGRADLLALQDDIAHAVADALQVQMSAAEQTRIFRKYTENAAAYEQYLQGRDQLVRFTANHVRAAVDHFEAALKIDDRYVPARAGLGMACAMMRLRFAPESETRAWSDRAEREARAALQLDPQLAEAHEAMAAVYRAVEFGWAEAIEESRLALELNPNLDQPHLYRAAAFYHLGLFDLVEPEVRSALDINPANRTDVARTRGVTALYEGRFRDAVRDLEEARELSGTTSFDYYVGSAHFYAGDAARAEALLEPRRSDLATDRRGQAVHASILASRGRREDAAALIRAVLGGAYVDHHVAYSLGAAYAQLGDAKQAKHWLEEAARTGFPCYPWFARDTLLDPLRPDPAFKQLLDDLQQSWRSAAAKYGSVIARVSP